ncbi:hypothetical protein LSH36_161g03001 [Paralvinella palmiformis]|uniref:Fibrinogen C-terminal domain-containing protein n=1 Tax=Paralvinella palmiformis TaxID=53620 RepID=A0AAD9JT86_9ANNE|nr:hypothetical protein LSH36_161g03001 [Paralvinella palmiformis]
MFGSLNGNLWMGLEFINRVTIGMGLDYEMRIDMRSFPRLINNSFTGSREEGYAKYREFSVGDSASFYKLHVSDYSGNWGDSMSKNDGIMFTANGTENDHDLISVNCAEVFVAPWWYALGSDSRLTGQYGMIVPDHVGYLDNTMTYFYHGIMWKTHLGSNEHMEMIEMKIRPK